jgi:hypothetical protein
MILRRGNQGAEVVKLQNMLNRAGIKCSTDGAFGPSTERAVKAFQKASGSSQDGIVGRKTWAALERLSRPVTADMESIAVLLSGYCTEQKYKLSGAQCPTNPPGMKLRRIGYESSNCVLFTGWLLSNCFPGVTFSADAWRGWMNSSSNSFTKRVPGYGPAVAVDWGIATPEPSSEGPWLLQTFTNRGGHSYIVLDHDEETGKILTLEANAWCNGIGWNQIGALRDVFNPGPNWADKVTQTWQNRVYGPNVAVHCVKLNITGVKDWLKRGK